MQIDVSAEHYAGIVRLAVAAGYDNVEALLAALANEPTADPRGKLSEDEVRRSASRKKTICLDQDVQGRPR
jgi:hypothetical protein